MNFRMNIEANRRANKCGLSAERKCMIKKERVSKRDRDEKQAV